MANQTQPFRQHHITKALRAAAAAGVANPMVEVRLPTGATITIGSGKPDAAVAAIPKQAKPSSRSSRSRLP